MAGDDVSLKIALYSGIFVRHDAVSNSLSVKLKILERLRDAGAGIEMTVFTRHSDYRAPCIQSLTSVEQLLRRQEFWSADVHMYEFAMRYDLFDAVFVIPRDRRIVVTEHNTTPPELVDDPIMKRECALSLVQRQNMSLANRVICDSEFNLELARSIGLPDERLRVMHLPPGHAAAPAPSGLGGHQGRVRLLYVGRFVRAKGVLDLLEAVETLWGRAEDRFELTLVGNPAFSEDGVTTQVQEFVDRCGGDSRVRTVLDANDEEVAKMFRSSDAFVIPSYHEGYCVPAVEAMSARCYVIGYDAGNLPNVLGGLGTTVPTGDVGALSGAIYTFVERACAGRDGTGSDVLPADAGDMNRAAWDESVERHLRDYSEVSYERAFLELLLEMAGPCGPSGAPNGSCVPNSAVSNRLDEVVSRRLAELAGGPPVG